MDRRAALVAACLLALALALSPIAAATPTIDGVWTETHKNNIYTAYCASSHNTYNCMLYLTYNASGTTLDYSKNNIFSGRLLSTHPKVVYSATWYTFPLNTTFTLAANGKTMVEADGNATWTRVPAGKKKDL